MKINEIIRRMSFLQLVPLKSDEGTPLANKTKVKIILNLVAYEKAVDDFNKDMQGIYSKLKPEGYDEHAFARVNELEKKKDITEAEKKELESIKQSEEYLSFAEAKKTLLKEYEEARASAAEGNDYNVSERAFTDEDLVSIADVIPSDKEFSIGRNESGEIQVNGITVLAEIGRIFII